MGGWEKRLGLTDLKRLELGQSADEAAQPLIVVLGVGGAEEEGGEVLTVDVEGLFGLFGWGVVGGWVGGWVIGWDAYVCPSRVASFFPLYLSGAGQGQHVRGGEVGGEEEGEGDEARQGVAFVLLGGLGGKRRRRRRRENSLLV